ncbi:VWA domain-containing protein [Arthrobacter sp. UYEF36]|uniref:vWA domain-containing protein n=1 Tax=Arthrobacter sp. UYEF36 TaxID=1756366 RepID=UPI0033908902
MTLNPILSWWVMGPLAAAIVLGLGWVLFRSRQQHAPSGEAGIRGWLFRGGLVLLLLLAACRPGIAGGTVQAAATDLNVFFVVDTSSSIAAEDHTPAGGQSGKGQAAGGQTAKGQAAGVPRLDGVREDIRAIARELAGARYSLVSFDSSATVRMPLTADTSALETAVAVLGPEVTDYSQGSSVTAARVVLAERLATARDSHPERPRLVFYFGDGEQTSAAAPQALGIDGSLVSGGAVLGYGTPDGGRMKENSGDPTRPAATYIQDPATGGEAVSRLDEDRLRDLARQLAVPYVHRAAGDAAAPMLQQATPGTLLRTGDTLDGRTELYWAPAFAAFVLALRETLLVSGQLRELRPAGRPVLRPVRRASPEALPGALPEALPPAGRGPGA